MKLRDKPCETCGWKFPGYHVCVEPDPTSINNPKARMRNLAYSVEISDSRRESMAEGQRTRWERYREQHSDRDSKIVAAYKEGSSFRGLATEFKISFDNAYNVVKRAAARGEVIIRPKGYNLRHAKEEV